MAERTDRHDSAFAAGGHDGAARRNLDGAFEETDSTTFGATTPAADDWHYGPAVAGADVQTYDTDVAARRARWLAAQQVVTTIRRNADGDSLNHTLRVQAETAEAHADVLKASLELAEQRAMPPPASAAVATPHADLAPMLRGVFTELATALAGSPGRTGGDATSRAARAALGDTIRTNALNMKKAERRSTTELRNFHTVIRHLRWAEQFALKATDDYKAALEVLGATCEPAEITLITEQAITAGANATAWNAACRAIVDHCLPGDTAIGHADDLLDAIKGRAPTESVTAYHSRYQGPLEDAMWLRERLGKDTSDDWLRQQLKNWSRKLNNQILAAACSQSGNRSFEGYYRTASQVESLAATASTPAGQPPVGRVSFALNAMGTGDRDNGAATGAEDRTPTDKVTLNALVDRVQETITAGHDRHRREVGARLNAIEDRMIDAETRSQGQRGRSPPPRVTDNVRPICGRCNISGHHADNCYTQLSRPNNTGRNNNNSFNADRKRGRDFGQD